jgi:L-threonylcarbamoyladenylate synthase
VSEVYEVDPQRPDVASIAGAAAAIEAGDLVVVPTETVYGLAARPDVPEATARLFEAKGRPGTLNLPVLAPTVDVAWTLGRPSEPARRLAAAFWPGPLTLVLPRTDRARHWALGDHAGTIAVRVPNHPLTTALLEVAGPLAATSANPSGLPPMAKPDELRKAFDPHVAVFLLLRPGEPSPAGVASTVVDCSGKGVAILRDGALLREELERVVGADLRVHPNG